MTSIVGIDPGQSGGFALINHEEAKAWKMPATEKDVFAMLEDLDRERDVFAYIEKVHSMPGQGVSSTFKFGMNYGMLRAFLIALYFPFETVTPRTWQKGLGIPPKMKTESKTQWKNRLKAKAQELFPDLKITLAVSDALLICEFGRRVREGLL